MTKSIQYLLLTALALITRQASSTPATSPQVVADFEEFPRQIGALGNPVPNPHKGLGWYAFNLASDAPGSLNPAHSPPNRAGTGARSQLLAGSQAKLSIHFQSAWVSVTANTEVGISTAISATMLITGIKAGTRAKVPVRVSYLPNTPVVGNGGTTNVNVQAPMEFKSLADLSDLEEATFEIETTAVPLAPQLTSALYLDEVTFTLKYI
ncbi:MAG: hypothetical protein M1816_001370 [Peltula sp. TS41687]|nr:MAG: hypothetical protein M1816_001370 [Peltula sp. TS41687]